MEVSGFGYQAIKQRLSARFPCNTPSSSPRRTPSPKTLEPPRETLNLSPKPVPKNVVYEHRRSRHLLMCVARKLTFVPDIRLLMVRAVADVADESAPLVARQSQSRKRSERRW
jgi:hypothetical protein